MSIVNLLQNTLAIEEIALPTSTEEIDKLTEGESNPVAEIQIANGDFSSEQGDVSFGVGSESKLVITAINRNNQCEGQEPEADEECRDDSVVQFPEYPWSYNERNGSRVGLAYDLYGKVNAALGIPAIPGVSPFSFGLKVGSRISSMYVNLHEPTVALDTTVKEDIESQFRLGLDPDNVLGLSPDKEYLVSEFDANFGFETEVSWGQIFSASSGLLRAVSPGNGVLEIEGGAKAFATFNVGIHSRLQLIASMLDQHTARIEFRKAKRNNGGIGAGFEIKAGIKNPDEIKNALDNLLARALNFRPELLDDLRKRLDQARKQFGVEQLADVELKNLVTTQLDRLGVDPSRLLQSIENAAWFEGATGELQRTRGIGSEAIKTLRDSLNQFHAGIQPDQLGNELGLIAQNILSSLELQSNDLPLLLGLLAEPGFREKIGQGIAGIDDAIVERLRSELNDLVGSFELENIEQETGRIIAKLLMEEFSIPLPEIYQRFRTGLLLERLAGDSDKLASLTKQLREIGAVLDIFTSEDASLRDVAKKLAQHFDIPELQIGDKLDELKNMIITAAEKQIEFSTRIEFNRIKTHEALFAFNFNAVDQNADTFRQVYRRLVKGDLQFAVQTSREQQALFSDTEFFEAETLEKRQSVQLRLFFKQGKQRISKQCEVLDLQGNRKLTFSESLLLNGGVGKRDWNTYFVLTAETDQFHPTPDTSHFQLAFETGLSYEGLVAGWFGRIPKKENRHAMLFMGKILRDSEKTEYSDRDISDRLEKEFKQKGKKPLFRLDLKVDQEALRWLWSDPVNIGLLQSNFEASWQSTKQTPALFPDLTGNSSTSDARKAVTLFAGFGELLTGNEPPEKLRKQMVRWTRAYRKAVRDEQGHDFVFKFCFLHALVQTLPGSLPGWTLTGSLQIDEREILFG